LIPPQAINALFSGAPGKILWPATHEWCTIMQVKIKQKKSYLLIVSEYLLPHCVSFVSKAGRKMQTLYM